MAFVTQEPTNVGKGCTSGAITLTIRAIRTMGEGALNWSGPVSKTSILTWESALKDYLLTESTTTEITARRIVGMQTGLPKTGTREMSFWTSARCN
jgi:hypothetical protein